MPTRTSLRRVGFHAQAHGRTQSIRWPNFSRTRPRKTARRRKKQRDGNLSEPARLLVRYLYVLEAISHESEETYNEWHGRRLVVLDLHGATKQVVHLDAEELIGVTAHGDEVYLSVPMPQALSCLDCFRLVSA